MTLMLHVAVAMTMILPHQGCHCHHLTTKGPTIEAACGLDSALDAILVQKLAQQHYPPKTMSKTFFQTFMMNHCILCRQTCGRRQNK